MINLISIIIPIYKNYNVFEKNVLEFYNFIKDTSIGYEFIVVNDGSEMPVSVFHLLTKLGCNIIFLNKNYGKGYAITSGVLNATGDFIIFTDADIPFQLENYKEMINLALIEQYDIIIGDRTLSSSKYFTKTSKLKFLRSKFFSKLVIGIINNEIRDTQCGLKGFKKEVAKKIFSSVKTKGFAIDVEILHIAKLLNYKIYRLPVQLRKNTESTVRILKHGIQVLFDLVKIRYYQITKTYNEKL